MSNFQFPNVYVSVFGRTGFPLNWRDEQSGVLPSAIIAYLEDSANEDQIKLVAGYLDYFIHAPVWDIPDNAFDEELKTLRESSKTLNTRQEIHEWIHKAMEIALDPL